MVKFEAFLHGVGIFLLLNIGYLLAFAKHHDFIRRCMSIGEKTLLQWLFILACTAALVYCFGSGAWHVFGWLPTGSGPRIALILIFALCAGVFAMNAIGSGIDDHYKLKHILELSKAVDSIAEAKGDLVKLRELYIHYGAIRESTIKEVPNYPFWNFRDSEKLTHSLKKIETIDKIMTILHWRIMHLESAH